MWYVSKGTDSCFQVLVERSSKLLEISVSIKLLQFQSLLLEP